MSQVFKSRIYKKSQEQNINCIYEVISNLLNEIQNRQKEATFNAGLDHLEQQNINTQTQLAHNSIQLATSTLSKINHGQKEINTQLQPGERCDALIISILAKINNSLPTTSLDSQTSCCYYQLACYYYQLTCCYYELASCYYQQACYDYPNNISYYQVAYY